MTDQPVTPRTRYAYISHLAAFFRWAVREEPEAHDEASADTPDAAPEAEATVEASASEASAGTAASSAVPEPPKAD